MEVVQLCNYIKQQNTFYQLPIQLKLIKCQRRKLHTHRVVLVVTGFLQHKRSLTQEIKIQTQSSLQQHKA
jgi:hypothetical protein